MQLGWLIMFENFTAIFHFYNVNIMESSPINFSYTLDLCIGSGQNKPNQTGLDLVKLNWVFQPNNYVHKYTFYHFMWFFDK